MPIKIKRLRAVAVASVGLGVFSFGSLTLAGSAAAALPLGCSVVWEHGHVHVLGGGRGRFMVPGVVSIVHVAQSAGMAAAATGPWWVRGERGGRPTGDPGAGALRRKVGWQGRR